MTEVCGPQAAEAWSGGLLEMDELGGGGGAWSAKPSHTHIPPRLERGHPAWASRNGDQCPRAHMHKDEALAQTEHHCLQAPAVGTRLGTQDHPTSQ